MPPRTVLITACAIGGGWLLTTAVSLRSRRAESQDGQAAAPDERAA
jgi:hypothetical protein